MSGADEFFTLARDLGSAPRKLARALYDVYKEQGDAFAEDWATNAKATAGRHAHQYPFFIDAEAHVGLAIEVEIGPRAEGQGLLGRVLELGSATSPPHLDGARALPAAEHRLERAADLAVAYVIP